ncbi:hypothetical protein MD484_g6451, partial [Candolleomyces efflorescens]
MEGGVLSYSEESLDNTASIGYAATPVKYMAVVSFTLFICDYLHTLELEVALIWPRRWNLVKFVYFWARYSPFVDVSMVFVFYFNTSTSAKFLIEGCKRIDQANSWLMTAGIISTEAILVIRTYGIVGGSRKFLIYLIIQMALLCGAGFVILGIALPSWVYGLPPPGYNGCFLLHTPGFGHLLFITFIIILLHEIILMVITLYIGWSKYRGQHRTPLIWILYRDGTLFFVLTAANIINILANSQGEVGLFTVFQRVVHSILSTRIILQVRKVASEERSIEFQLTDFGSSAVSLSCAAILRRANNSLVWGRQTLYVRERISVTPSTTTLSSATRPQSRWSGVAGHGAGQLRQVGTWSLGGEVNAFGEAKSTRYLCPSIAS